MFASKLLRADRSAAVLLSTGAQVAVFRAGGWLYGLSNIDPFTGAAVISRGIVGDTAGEPIVVSPMHKHRFSLRTGISLDDPARTLSRYSVREHGDQVIVDATPRPAIHP
ncbi:nitrite reductase small subunit NirD [Spiractinospora alimapuensis]|uniref:nitrite reductase small subunit NirD n=1 Tax=Spiractinospora alimapuensis TaxID=2820884 RepID=UPI003744AFEE